MAESLSFSKLAKELVDRLGQPEGAVDKKVLNEALLALSRAEAAVAEAMHFALIVKK
jgi:hypothetical protein